jgi:hypothetical protein
MFFGMKLVFTELTGHDCDPIDFTAIITHLLFQSAKDGNTPVEHDEMPDDDCDEDDEEFPEGNEGEYIEDNDELVEDEDDYDYYDDEEDWLDDNRLR